MSGVYAKCFQRGLFTHSGTEPVKVHDRLRKSMLSYRADFESASDAVIDRTSVGPVAMWTGDHTPSIAKRSKVLDSVEGYFRDGLARSTVFPIFRSLRSRGLRMSSSSLRVSTQKRLRSLSVALVSVQWGCHRCLFCQAAALQQECRRSTQWKEIPIWNAVTF